MAECDSPELTHKQRMWTALRSVACHFSKPTQFL